MHTKSLIDIALISMIAGAIGYGLGHYFTNRSDDVFSQNQQTVFAETSLSIEAAKQQREIGYKDINTISDVLSLPSLFAQKEALHTIAGRSNKVQLLLLIKGSTGVANTQQRNNYVSILLARLTELDPQKAVDIAIQAFEKRDYYLLSEVFLNWAKLDLEAAIKRANTIKEQYQHETAAQGILSSVDVEDVALQIELAQRLGLQSNEEQFVSNALIEKANQEPEAAMQEAMLMPKGNDRENTMISVMDAWASDNPEDAFAYTERVNDKVMQQRLQETVLYRWAETDPKEAYEMMLTLPKSSIINVSYTIFSNLANQDPQEALNFINEIPSSRQRSEAYSAAITTWSAKDALAAANFVAQLDNKQLKNQLASTIIQYLSQQSPDDALIWAQEMDPNGQLYLQDTVIGQIASQDPQRALQLAQASPQATLRKQLSLTVINNISYTDPVSAAAIIDQLPASEVTGELVNSVIYGWASSDPEAAMAWVNTKSGQLREDALISIGSQLASVDPDLAASYLPQLNGNVRENWAENITYYYSSYDLAEAATWIENFRGETMYGNLLSAVISTAAGTDVDYALQLAQNAPNQEIRNTNIRLIADQISYNNPQRAQQLYARLPAEEASTELAYQ